jgi:hypothetical protein
LRRPTSIHTPAIAQVKDGKLAVAITLEDIVDLDDASNPEEQMSAVRKLLHEKDPGGKLMEYRDLAQTMVNQQATGAYKHVCFYT